MVDKNEILEYAKKIKEERPETTKEEMRELLEAKFIRKTDPLQIAAVRGTSLGAVHNPLDWLRGLGKLFSGAANVLDGNEPEGMKEMIDGVLEILY